MIQEVVAGIEVLLAECALTDELVGHFPLQVHHEFKHLIVGLSGEHNLARVQLIDSGEGGPQIYVKVIAHTQNCKGKGIGLMSAYL